MNPLMSEKIMSAVRQLGADLLPLRQRVERFSEELDEEKEIRRRDFKRLERRVDRLKRRMDELDGKTH